MATLKRPEPGLIFASVLYRPDELSKQDLQELWSERYSLDGEFFPKFNPSIEYYSKEMGKGLERVILWDNKAFPREELVEGKVWADRVEQGHLKAGPAWSILT